MRKRTENPLQGDLEWWGGLKPAEKATTLGSVLQLVVSLLMMCSDDAPLWWYVIAVALLAGGVGMARTLPLDKLEE